MAIGIGEILRNSVKEKLMRDEVVASMTVRLVRGLVVVLVCEDNLVRGASGVAVQNFNRMFGYPETTALLP